MTIEALVFDPRRSSTPSAAKARIDAKSVSARSGTLAARPLVRSPLPPLITQEAKGKNKNLFLSEVIDASRLDVLRSLYRCVVAPTKNTKVLAQDEADEVFRSPHVQDLVIGILVDEADNVVVLYRGNFETLMVPFSSFTVSSPSRPKPKFKDAEVIDYGQTIRLGEYEAAVDALLYEHDPDYRRRSKKNQLQVDQSFGSSLRRLRLIRGLKLSDFRPITEKEMGRIERGEVKKPQKKTLEKIAKRLKVSVEDISTF
jgi:DNA-binding Xre family transcriptional regulator